MSDNRNHEASTASKAMFEAIRKIALYGVVDSKTGVIKGTERMRGYVVKINTEGELAGTVDVQEYVDYESEEDVESLIGYHEGVFLNSTQSNTGMQLVPRLYSDVMFVRDPTTHKEYISMSSQLDLINFDCHEQVSIGVTEREVIDVEDEDGPDVDEAKPTGNSTVTHYTKDGIVDSVVVDNEEKTTLTVSSEGIEAQTKEGRFLIGNDKSVIEMGKSSVTVKDGQVCVGSESGNEDAVLGQKLVSILNKLCAAIMAATDSLGKPLTVELASVTGQLSSILSKSVKIQS